MICFQLCVQVDLSTPESLRYKQRWHFKNKIFAHQDVWLVKDSNAHCNLYSSYFCQDGKYNTESLQAHSNLWLQLFYLLEIDLELVRRRIGALKSRASIEGLTTAHLSVLSTSLINKTVSCFLNMTPELILDIQGNVNYTKSMTK